MKIMCGIFVTISLMALSSYMFDHAEHQLLLAILSFLIGGVCYAKGNKDKVNQDIYKG
jgi:hypothetical protein